METGALEADPIEAAFHRLQIEILISRKALVTQSAWDYDLCSPFWRLYVNNGPGASIIHRRAPIPLREGHIYLIPAWTRFQTRVHRPTYQSFIHFNFNGLPSVLMRRIFYRPILLPPISLLRQLSQRWQAGLRGIPSLNDWEWARALVHAAVAAMSSRLPAAHHQDCLRALTQSHRYRPALEAIEQRLSQPPLNSELAALCHTSTDHFIREFKRILGMTPARYGLERRIAVAAHLLTESTHTIDDIAEKTGFTDRFHFSRVFKSQISMAPATYRKMHR